MVEGGNGETESVASDLDRRRRAARRGRGSAAYQTRRAQLMTAAGEVFKQRGYSRTTLADVAEALGVDRASIYYYVGSKEELFQEVVGEAVERNAEMAGSIVESTGTPAEKLRQLITQMMVSYAESYPFLYVYIQENLKDVTPSRSEWAQHMRRVNKKYENAVVAIVQSGVDDGSFETDAEPWLIAFGIIGMVSWSNRWFNPTTSLVSAEQIARVYADTVINGLTAR